MIMMGLYLPHTVFPTVRNFCVSGKVQIEEIALANDSVSSHGPWYKFPVKIGSACDNDVVLRYFTLSSYLY